MTGMWSLGGLSIRELLKRTARESWEDDVFGQAARLAFYHFLAIFPAILLILLPLSRLAWAGTDMRNLLAGSFRPFLPQNAASLVSDVIRDLNANAHAGGAVLALGVIGAVWAGINASWSMIVGLNTAYETRENREWHKIAVIATSLGVAVIAMVFAALLTTHLLGGSFRGPAPLSVLAPLARWTAIVCILLISFALFYRFGPNVPQQRWAWSTPGAVFAAMLWIGLTLVFRGYFDAFAPYNQIYGRAAAAAALMLWLYLTSATVLIGAELNSEIEKERRKGAQLRGHPPAR